jgi:hypothetical protein
MDPPREHSVWGLVLRMGQSENDGLKQKTHQNLERLGAETGFCSGIIDESRGPR